MPSCARLPQLGRGFGMLALAAILTVAYTRLSMTVEVNSDQASYALQAQDLLHGNLILRSWTLSNISAYVPDLVLYAVTISVAGIGTTSVHIANALMYALTVIVAAVLAGSGAAARRWIGATIAAALLVAPQLGLGTRLLVEEGAHIGVALMLVLGLLVTDRFPAGRWTAAGVFAILTAGIVADSLLAVVGALPIAAVCGYRLWRRRTDDPRFEKELFAAAALSVAAAALVLLAVRRLHGFRTYPLTPSPAGPHDVVHFFGLATRGFAAMFGVDPTNLTGVGDYAGVAMHAIGLLFAVACVAVAVVTWTKGRLDRVSEILLVALAVDVAAFLFTAHGETSRYLIPGFVSATVLAGRIGTPWLRSPRRSWLLAAIAAGYIATLAVSLLAHSAPSVHPWSHWLIDHDLHRGVGSYWQASSVTVETGGFVVVRPILADGKKVNGYAWESNQRWYTPSELGDVRFVIFDRTDKSFGVDQTNLEAVFGTESQIERFGNVWIMLWDQNLVPSMTLSSG